jgi:crotonobetainyl-CoA:carnitine CoA-transferase CaiB-like acyl-CoA transferase
LGAVPPKLVREALARASAREWAERFGQSVPCAEVRPVEDMFDHPQVEAMGFMRPYRSEQAGNYLGLAQWAHFGGAVQDGAQAAAHEAGQDAGQDAAGRAAPALGEHSRTILSALGYTADEIDHLLHASVVQ